MLANPRMPVALPEEPSEIRILVVGEGPGEIEDIQGIPFVGPTGRFLRECIPPKWRKKLYWTNCVLCRPPNNRTPEPREQECCSTYLYSNIDKIQPHVIVCVGDVALNHFFTNANNISKMHGVYFPIKIKDTTCWCYPIFHPSYVTIMGHNDSTNYVLPVFKADIRRLFDNIEFFSQRPTIHTLPKEIDYPKNILEARNLYARLKHPPLIDFETWKKKPYLQEARILTSAFSDGDTTFAFPVDWPGLIDSWGKEFLFEVLSTCEHWGAHNLPFELVWQLYLTGKWPKRLEDTMAIGRLFHGRYGILGLEDQTLIHLGVNVKANTGVDATRCLEYPLELVLRYNGDDTWGAAKIFQCDLLPENQRENYDRVIDTIRSTVAMELAGLPINLKETIKFKQDLVEKCKVIEKQAQAIQEVQKFEKENSTQFLITSNQDVGHVLTRYCKIELPFTEKGQNYATGEEILEKFLDKHQLVNLTLDHREVQKLLSTYVEPILRGEIIGTDGLLHPSYTVVLTRTGRLSSEDPNIQNWPKRMHQEIRRQLIPPPGFLMVAYDYGQLEARVIAMASNDKAFKESIIKGIDVHGKWLDRAVELYPDYWDRLKKKTGQTEEKKVRKAGRDIIKTDFVFASFYGAQPPGISKRTMMPINIVEQMHEEFWNTYPTAKIWVNERFEEYKSTGLIHTLTNRIRDEVLPGNEPANSPIQGTASDIVVTAQNSLFFRSFIDEKYFMPRINIHDDLTFFLRDDNSAEKYMKQIAEEIVRPRFPFITVPLKTEMKVGYNWGELEECADFIGPYYDDSGSLVYVN